MPENLFLQWKDFKENVNSAFGRLRNDREFTDVTLASEDGQQMEAHKVILAASSPFFEEILEKNRHPHPLIYLKGIQSKHLLAALDFLYFGEANVLEEDLESFLAITEDLRLKGFTDQKQIPINKVVGEKGKYDEDASEENTKKSSQPPSSPNQQDSSKLQALQEKVNAMMEKTDNPVFTGKQASDGTSNEEKVYICKVCGKEGRVTQISNHIETNHLQGISIPCGFCGKVFTTRNALTIHQTLIH